MGEQRWLDRDRRKVSYCFGSVIVGTLNWRRPYTWRLRTRCRARPRRLRHANAERL